MQSRLYDGPTGIKTKNFWNSYVIDHATKIRPVVSERKKEGEQIWLPLHASKNV
jgi:hypothetical protein